MTWAPPKHPRGQVRAYRVEYYNAATDELLERTIEDPEELAYILPSDVDKKSSNYINLVCSAQEAYIRLLA